MVAHLRKPSVATGLLLRKLLTVLSCTMTNFASPFSSATHGYPNDNDYKCSRWTKKNISNLHFPPVTADFTLANYVLQRYQHRSLRTQKNCFPKHMVIRQASHSGYQSEENSSYKKEKPCDWSSRNCSGDGGCFRLRVRLQIVPINFLKPVIKDYTSDDNTFY